MTSSGGSCYFKTVKFGGHCHYSICDIAVVRKETKTNFKNDRNYLTIFAKWSDIVLNFDPNWHDTKEWLLIQFTLSSRERYKNYF